MGEDKDKLKKVLKMVNEGDISRDVAEEIIRGEICPKCSAPGYRLEIVDLLDNFALIQCRQCGYEYSFDFTSWL